MDIETYRSSTGPKRPMIISTTPQTSLLRQRGRSSPALPSTPRIARPRLSHGSAMPQYLSSTGGAAECIATTELPIVQTRTTTAQTRLKNRKTVSASLLSCRTSFPARGLDPGSQRNLSPIDHQNHPCPSRLPTDPNTLRPRSSRVMSRST